MQFHCTIQPAYSNLCRTVLTQESIVSGLDNADRTQRVTWLTSRSEEQNTRSRISCRVVISVAGLFKQGRSPYETPARHKCSTQHESRPAADSQASVRPCQPASLLRSWSASAQVMSAEEFRHDWGDIYDQLLAAERARAITPLNDRYLLERIRPLLQRIQDFLQGAAMRARSPKLSATGSLSATPWRCFERAQPCGAASTRMKSTPGSTSGLRSSARPVGRE